MSDEVSDTRARSWASKTVEAYAKAVLGGTTGLHDHIVSAHRPCLFANMIDEGQIDRVNRAIEEWETWSSRSPGPRCQSLLYLAL
jgi:hypothetical protein